jgi:hypothetical protein
MKIGERMRRVLVLLLAVGILVGISVVANTVSVSDNTCDEDVDIFSNDFLEGIGDPAPCGGGGSDGSGGGTPG